MVAAPLLSNAMFTKSDGLNEPGTTVHKAVPDSTGAAEIHFHSHGDSTNNEAHAHDPHFHYHGGVGRSHLPPGADGTPVTMRSLLALGISGGLRPCPSALMLLLAAIAPHRVGFGLILVTSFSIGLASVLTAVGLLFIKSSRLLGRVPAFSIASRWLPAFSALVIGVLGIGITLGSIAQLASD
ncbi:MAG TPA: hypothetical protein DDX81_11470 [Desulfofustis sp.]|jgi:nickel/cobalt exporter|nr:hypothetical protein [Desulfofustis sp.]